MKKVAIVGVEGSGKTVMLAGLGDLYSRPDDKGYFLAPKDFNTSAYVAELMERLRCGIWPAATADDLFQGLEWTLRRRSDTGGRPTDICELSCLDFPGEVYRKAFVDTKGQRSEEMQRQIESLRNYIEQADSLLVLVNLADVITNGLASRRVHESIWVTSAILEEVLKKRFLRTTPRVAIVLSQADSYAATIKKCGGAKSVLKKYLPHVYNSFGWLDVFETYTIDKTSLDDEGAMVPDPSFTAEGLRPIMRWICDGIVKDMPSCNPEPQRAVQQGKQINENVSSKPEPVVQDNENVSSKPEPVVQKKVNVFVFALNLIAAFGSAVGCLVSGHWGVAIFLGVISLALASLRGDKDAKQDVGWWLAGIPFLVLAGVLGSTLHWGWAILGLMATAVLDKVSKKKK